MATAHNPNHPPDKGPCGFCARFDFSCVKAQIDKYGARIVTAICSGAYPQDEQFNFCPVCGRFLKEGVDDGN